MTYSNVRSDVGSLPTWSMNTNIHKTGHNGFDGVITTDERNPKDDARKARKILNGTDFSQNGYNALMLTQNALAFA